MSSSVLENFPPPPDRGWVTACEQHGSLVHVPSSQSVPSLHQLYGYPELSLTQDIHKGSYLKENAKSAFLTHDETIQQRILHAWYELGITGAFEELANNKGETPTFLASFAQGILTFIRWANSFSLYPHLLLPSEDMIAQFSNIYDWTTCPVRAFAWHPNTTKFAFALKDDSIRVHMKGSDVVPTLKHKVQKNVSVIAWQPFSASVLAVGCQSCVLIWHVEPTSLSTRPSASCAQVLQQNGPVTCLSWSPSGLTLLAASPADTAVMTWDVPMETCIPLRRFGGGGVTHLAWSPDGSKVFAATPSPFFRVWETQTWACEKWSNLSSRCKVACWSQDGSILFFSTENEPIIYSLKFSAVQSVNSDCIGGAKSAVACASLSEVELLTQADEAITVGGGIQDMCLDPTGNRLAVMFQGSKPERRECNLIALFQIRTKPMTEISPCGFVTGELGAIPRMITFKPNCDFGAILTVLWSNGHVSFIPLRFVTDGRQDYNQHLQTSEYNCLTRSHLYTEH